MAEWLRRWTANPLGSARVGSNPIIVAPPHWFYGVMVSTLDLNPAIRVQISVEPEVMIKSRSENTRNARKIERIENRVGWLTSNKKGYRIAKGLQRVGHD